MAPNFDCQQSFFTLAMHPRLLTNFAFRHVNLVLRPALQRNPPQQPHLIDNPLFNGIGLLEIAIAIRYSTCDRCDPVAKLRMRRKNCQQRLVAEFRRRHALKSHPFVIRQHTPHHFESHPCVNGFAR